MVRLLMKKEGKEWERVIDVDLNGYFYCCHEIVPHMIGNRWGRIVNVSSQAARSGGQIRGKANSASRFGDRGKIDIEYHKAV